MSTSPTREGSANAGGGGSSNGGNGADEKPRLSEHEKKANHIASGVCFPLPPLPVLSMLFRSYQQRYGYMLRQADLNRAKAPTSNPRRVRSPDRARTWIRGTRQE